MLDIYFSPRTFYSSMSDSLSDATTVAIDSSNARKRTRLSNDSSRVAILSGYEAAPASLREGILAAESTLLDFTCELGRRTAAYNLRRVLPVDVASSDIEIASMDVTDEGEARDCDFLASSNLMFFEFIGLPLQ